MSESVSVQLFDANLRRVGFFQSAAAIRRSFDLGRSGKLSVKISLDDDLVDEIRPERGLALVVESTKYPVPWVGALTNIDQARSSSTITLQARDLGNVLADRFLPRDAVIRGRDVVQAVHQVLDLAELNGPLGLVPGRITGAGTPLEVEVAHTSVATALDRVTGAVGMEWWLSHRVPSPESEQPVRTVLNAAPYRGLDRYEFLALTETNARWDSAAETPGLAIASTTIVGGVPSPISGVNDRASSTAALGDVSGLAPHGFEGEVPLATGRALTSRERLDVVDHLREAGLLTEAAAAAQGRQHGSVLKYLDAVAFDTANWDHLAVGNVVRAVFDEAFRVGLDRPVRILHASPIEEEASCGLVLQVLAPPVDRG